MARKSYPTDLKDEEWEMIKPLIPEEKPGGRPRGQEIREVVNAIFYILRAGCAWRMLPNDFPRWFNVYHYFHCWKRDGTWERINAHLRREMRIQEGRNSEPSAGIVDSQSVKTTSRGGDHGYDAGKKINGRKRHILVDTLGLLLCVVVHAGNIQDRDGARLLFAKAKSLFPSLKLVWADGGYAGQLITWVMLTCSWILEIVKRSDAPGFQLVKRRWVVERSFAWFGMYRRLSKDYEFLTSSSEAMIYAAMSHIMLRRLARANSS